MGGWEGGFEGQKVEDLKLVYLLPWLASMSGKLFRSFPENACYP